MEIDSTIFQDLESFGNREVFKIAMEKFWIFDWENSAMFVLLYLDLVIT